MNLYEKISEDVKSSLKSKNSKRVSTLRLILSSINNERLKSKSGTVNEDTIISILKKAEKQRLESISAYKAGNRLDLVATEEKELEIIREYLPKMLNDEEIRNIVKQTIEEVGNNPGVIMKTIMSKYKNCIDGKRTKEILTAELGNYQI